MTDMITGQDSETGDDLPEEDGPGPEDGETTVLFEGDCGQLAADVRRTLVAILKQRYVSAEQDPGLWRVLTENRAALESRLNDMFLQLAVYREYGIAYKKQATPEGAGKFPSLVRNTAYTREQTVIMVHLRGVFRSAVSAGDDAAFIDGRELIEEASNYLPSTVTNHVEAERAAQRAIDALEKDGILLEAGEGRYRISPVIEVLLPVSTLRELADSLARQRGAPGRTPAEGEEPDEDQDEENSWP